MTNQQLQQEFVKALSLKLPDLYQEMQPFVSSQKNGKNYKVPQRGLLFQPIQSIMDVLNNSYLYANPETIIDAFSILDHDRKGVIDEDDLRTILRKYAPDLKGKEIEEILEKPNVTTNGKVNYKAFVQYWVDQ